MIIPLIMDIYTMANCNSHNQRVAIPWHHGTSDGSEGTSTRDEALRSQTSEALVFCCGPLGHHQKNGGLTMKKGG